MKYTTVKIGRIWGHCDMKCGLLVGLVVIQRPSCISDLCEPIRVELTLHRYLRHKSINQSIRVCLYSRATSRLIVCIRNVQLIMSGYDFLKSQVLSC